MTAARPLVGFYGDDFTGSSENLAQFHRSGLRTRLYLKVPPIAELREAAGQLDVIGFAGTARAMNCEQMAAEIQPAFDALKALGCRILQYKICSTFDSAPETGNFGFAAEMITRGGRDFDTAVLAATPDFGRYTAFGNHYARFGKDVLRLDRHPGMSSHPRTPMREADLRLHLDTLCALPFANICLPEIGSPGTLTARIATLFSEGKGIVFDGVTNDDVAAVVRALWERSAIHPLFAIAAQGFAQHLGRTLAGMRAENELETVRTTIPPVDNLLVLSGSCAIQTGRQIDAALAAGWAGIALDPAGLCDERTTLDAVDAIGPQVLENLEAGRPTIVYTARGNVVDREAFEDIPPQHIGRVYAALMGAARRQTAIPRVVFAGGDSSSYSIRHSGADALTIKVFDEVQQGHLCELISEDPHLNGVEVLLKGGQVGDEDYFLRVRNGTDR